MTYSDLDDEIPPMTYHLAGGEVVDEIAVERCVAGTLHGFALTQQERELAAAKLYRSGAPMAHIAAQTGIAARYIKTAAERAGFIPLTRNRLVSANPGKFTPEQLESARRSVTELARDADDARELLLALGLITTRPVRATTSLGDARQEAEIA